METFPTDFEVFTNNDHFPFGKAEYITIFDSNLEIVYITTKQMDCKAGTTELRTNVFAVRLFALFAPNSANSEQQFFS